MCVCVQVRAVHLPIKRHPRTDVRLTYDGVPRRRSAPRPSQGIFYYLFYHAHRAHATWAEAASPSWNVDHYWGPYKPWRPAGPQNLPHATVRYLWRLSSIESTMRTRCVSVLQGLRDTLRRRGSWFDPPTHKQRGLRNIAVFPVLPSPRLAELRVRSLSPTRPVHLMG